MSPAQETFAQIVISGQFCNLVVFSHCRWSNFGHFDQRWSLAGVPRATECQLGWSSHCRSQRSVTLTSSPPPPPPPAPIHSPPPPSPALAPAPANYPSTCTCTWASTGSCTWTLCLFGVLPFSWIRFFWDWWSSSALGLIGKAGNQVWTL